MTALDFSTIETIETAVTATRRMYLSGQTRSLEFRKTVLRGLLRFLDEEKEALCEAAFKDIHRHPFETLLSDVSVIKKDIKGFLKNLNRLASPSYPEAGWVFKGNAVIRKEPKGVVLVIGAWNYAVQTSISPVVAALAAGNTVILKPSELAPHVAQLFADRLKHYVDPSVLAVINGGADETTRLLEHPLDHIFYTGNGTVGRIIMTAAAKQLASVTLELGGKSPTLVLPDANLDVTAQRIVWGKFFNAGQTCIAPDFVVVTQANADALIEKMKSTIVTRFGSNPQKSNSLARIIHPRHFDRLIQVLESVPEKWIVHGGDTDREDLYIAPTLVKVPAGDIEGSLLMDAEIFGPILPIITVPTIESIVPSLVSRETPLALYIFGENKHNINKLLDQLPSGGACINNVMMHASRPSLPFGGQGASGIGSYHGEHGFHELSHKRSVLITSTSGEAVLEAVYPPYTAAKMTLAEIDTSGSTGGGIIKTVMDAMAALWRIYVSPLPVEHAKSD